jgi:hypothetical protein
MGGEILPARHQYDLAPQSSACLAELPYHGELIHARWSGEASWSPLAAVGPRDQCFPSTQPLTPRRAGAGHTRAARLRAVTHRIRCGLMLCIFLLAAPFTRADEAQNCHIGSYRLKDGSLVDIAPAADDTLRWRRFDGTTGVLHTATRGRWSSTYGWTGRPDGKTVSFSVAAPARSNLTAHRDVASRLR